MKKVFDNTYTRVVLFLFFLYLFFVSIEMMSTAFKLFGHGFAQKLMTTTANPIVGLLIGLATTSLVQSSSSVTSIIVGLVAGGTLSIRHAVPMVMGANIGTTVTNMIVSMGHIGRKQEFEKAIAGATVHDFFNVLAVIVFLPLEAMFHIIEKTATALEVAFKSSGGLTFISPLKAIVGPVEHLLSKSIISLVSSPPWLRSVVLLVFALLMLFLALHQMVTLMKKLMIGKIENLIHAYLFKSPLRSLMLGLALTSVIQSSSATTSLIVPLAGAGILTVEEIFPYVLGANIGTTVTTILASLVTKSPAAIIVAFSHLTFNIMGTILFYPLRIIPITLAKNYAKFLAKYRYLAPILLIVLFFILPLTLIFLINGGF
ncbi:Na/Pi symporter [bacterium]|nr:Na/Pi symporter [bacterium]